MASTADIQVSANRGRTTQELHRDALSEKKKKKRKHTPVEGAAEGKQGGMILATKADRAALESYATPQTHTHTQSNHNYSGNRFDADSHCNLD